VVLTSRRRGPEHELAARRRLGPVLAAEQAAFVVGIGAGLLLMSDRGWGLGHARWLAVKVALTAFLLVPLQAMHAWIVQGWIARGLRQTPQPPWSKDLERGLGMEDMWRALAAPLLALALPLLVWLSVARPW
jgi:hypothetical protein